VQLSCINLDGLPMPILHRIEHSPSVLSLSAWQRALVVSLAGLLLWLGVWWALVERVS